MLILGARIKKPALLRARMHKINLDVSFNNLRLDI